MDQSHQTIHVILTGGTIDSYFDSTKDSIVVGKKSVLPDYLKKLKLHNKLKFTVVTLKDSRELRHKDRNRILQEIKSSKNRMIIVAHGTYTMPDTAQYLKEGIQNTDKTVVLTGSMTPIRGFDFSDAGFNLGYAISKVQELPCGVYICMNGKVFDPDKVDKNKVKGRFEEVG